MKKKLNSGGEFSIAEIGEIWIAIYTDRPRIEITYVKDGEEHTKTKRYRLVRLPPIKLLLSLFKRYDFEYINAMINLRKIGIIDIFRKIDLEQVKKRLDRLDQLDRLYIIYNNYSELLKLKNYINNLYEKELNKKEEEGIPLESDQSDQSVQKYIENRIKTLENTKSAKENKETKGNLDQYVQEEKKSEEKVNVRILEDLGKVVDGDTEHILRKEDIVSISPGLAEALISQGKAEKINRGGLENGS